MDELQGISVTGVGRVTVEPDIATLSIGVSMAGSDLETIRSGASAKLAGARDHLLAAGVDRTDVQTDRLNVHTSFDSQVRQTTHYLNTGLRATIRDLVAAPAIVNEIFQIVGDGLELHGLTFGTEDPDAGADEARARAFADAQRKAQHLAELAGVSLGSVQSIVEGGPAHGGPPRMLRAMAASAEMDMPIEAGELETSASVSVRWAIAD